VCLCGGFASLWAIILGDDGMIYSGQYRHQQYCYCHLQALLEPSPLDFSPGATAHVRDNGTLANSMSRLVRSGLRAPEVIAHPLDLDLADIARLHPDQVRLACAAVTIQGPNPPVRPEVLAHDLFLIGNRRNILLKLSRA
jgi:hypothetical protein